MVSFSNLNSILNIILPSFIIVKLPWFSSRDFSTPSFHVSVLSSTVISHFLLLALLLLSHVELYRRKILTREVTTASHTVIQPTWRTFDVAKAVDNVRPYLSHLVSSVPTIHFSFSIHSSIALSTLLKPTRFMHRDITLHSWPWLYKGLQTRLSLQVIYINGITKITV